MLLRLSAQDRRYLLLKTFCIQNAAESCDPNRFSNDRRTLLAEKLGVLLLPSGRGEANAAPGLDACAA